jgi:hypothetical protein
VEGGVVHIIKALAQHPVATQSLAEDDSLQLMFHMIALGGMIPMLSHSDSFKKIAAATPPRIASSTCHAGPSLICINSFCPIKNALDCMCTPVWESCLTPNPKPLCIGLQRLIVFSSYWWIFQILGLLLTSDQWKQCKVY